MTQKKIDKKLKILYKKGVMKNNQMRKLEGKYPLLFGIK